MIKQLNFGQFVFLYFVARNEDVEFVRELITQLKARGAPNWTLPKGPKKKDGRQEAQPDKNLGIPLEKLKGGESAPPSYNLAQLDPPLDEKSSLPPITMDYSNHQTRTYPPIVHKEPTDGVLPEYSESATLRKRKDSTEDKRED